MFTNNSAPAELSQKDKKCKVFGINHFSTTRIRILVKIIFSNDGTLNEKNIISCNSIFFFQSIYYSCRLPIFIRKPFKWSTVLMYDTGLDRTVCNFLIIRIPNTEYHNIVKEHSYWTVLNIIIYLGILENKCHSNTTLFEMYFFKWHCWGTFNKTTQKKSIFHKRK